MTIQGYRRHIFALSLLRAAGGPSTGRCCAAAGTVPGWPKTATPLPELRDHSGSHDPTIRAPHGFTRVELVEKIGIIQGLVSDYERGKLRRHPDMLSRFAGGLQVSIDELLGLEPATKSNASPVDRRFLRRLRAIKGLPKRDREALLRTIDAFLAARQAS